MGATEEKGQEGLKIIIALIGLLISKSRRPPPPYSLLECDHHCTQIG